MNVIAGIVTYNPEINRLNENISRLLKQCQEIVIVDNNSPNIECIREIIEENKNISLICNNRNLGIAKALNQLLEVAYVRGFKWILTMDQDSLLLPGIVERYVEFENDKSVAMVTCTIQERNDTETTKSRNETAYENVRKCITSGCYTNVEAVMQVGLFDESYFIDYVDFDMCYRLLLQGYQIIKVNHVGLLHSTGALEPFRVMGKNVKVGKRNIYIYHENPIRIFYFFRNTVYFWRKYGWRGREFTNPLHIAWRALLVVLYETPKAEKIKMIFRGIRDGCRKEIV